MTIPIKLQINIISQGGNMKKIRVPSNKICDSPELTEFIIQQGLQKLAIDQGKAKGCKHPVLNPAGKMPKLPPLMAKKFLNHLVI